MSAQVILFPRRMTAAEKALNSRWSDKIEAERQHLERRAAWFRETYQGFLPGGAA